MWLGNHTPRVSHYLNTPRLHFQPFWGISRGWGRNWEHLNAFTTSHHGIDRIWSLMWFLAQTSEWKTHGNLHRCCSHKLASYGLTQLCIWFAYITKSDCAKCITTLLYSIRNSYFLKLDKYVTSISLKSRNREHMCKRKQQLDIVTLLSALLTFQ